MSSLRSEGKCELIKETMSRRGRIQATIKLQKTDRIPVAPHIGQFAVQHSGLSPYQALRKKDLLFESIWKLWVELGGWDAGETISPWLLMRTTPGAVKTAWQMHGTGADYVTEPQYIEREEITIKDYDKIINRGWSGFLEEFLPRTLGRSLSEVKELEERAIIQFKEEDKYWEERGVPLLYFSGTFAMTPMHILSPYRSFPQFTMDLFRCPEKVVAAMDAMVSDLIEITINNQKRCGVTAITIACERGNTDFYSPKFYERFDFPYLKRMVDAFVSEGFITLLFWESNWTQNLHYLKEMPKARCVLGTDGTTNLFKAKEILRNHMCIYGDVPPDLLQLGAPSDVEGYVKRLIDVVGDGGGFILSSGSWVPAKAKLENVRIMIDTAKRYLPRSW